MDNYLRALGNAPLPVTLPTPLQLCSVSPKSYESEKGKRKGVGNSLVVLFFTIPFALWW